MCDSCGCSGDVGDLPEEHGHRHLHDGGHQHPHSREVAHEHPVIHPSEGAILARNADIAQRTRQLVAARRVLALNLVSSPGSGKTTLLERTIRELSQRRAIQVIEGDQATSRDADRIRAAGAAAVQINTGTGCHLDAAMVERGLAQLEPPPGALVFIENVGNLVCPALFDLGERAKILIASVTEGDDKPLKYPHMFRASQLVLLNKVDLLAHVPFAVERFVANVERVNPRLPVILVSALRGTGLAEWYAWLRAIDDGP